MLVADVRSSLRASTLPQWARTKMRRDGGFHPFPTLKHISFVNLTQQPWWSKSLLLPPLWLPRPLSLLLAGVSPIVRLGVKMIDMSSNLGAFCWCDLLCVGIDTEVYRECPCLLLHFLNTLILILHTNIELGFSHFRIFSLCNFTANARLQNRPFASKTTLNAEWEKEWKETDFEGDLAKVQKEAEERLDSKIAELMSNIEKTGASGN